VVVLTPGSSVASKNNNTINEACVDFLDFLDEHAGNLNMNMTEDEDDDANAIDEVSQLLEDFVREEEGDVDQAVTVAAAAAAGPSASQEKVVSSPPLSRMPEIPDIMAITRNIIITTVPTVPVVPLMMSMQPEHSTFVMPKIPKVTLAVARKTLRAVSTNPNPTSTSTEVDAIVDTTTLTRRQRVERWQKKRLRRNWSKKHVTNEYYGLRKKTASKRRRVGGKFSGSSVSWVSCS